MSENHFDLVLEQLKERSVDRLLTADTFDASAFEMFKNHLWKKADVLKHESAISKQILLSLRSAVRAIQSRAEYLPDVREQLHWANDFQSLLDRLIASETREELQPGVPRII